MPVSKLKYLGDLRISAVHLKSETELITDAPVDNHGKGSSFSPTDLTAVSLATCILTVIGIVARKDNMTGIDGAEAEVTKVMYNDPRRIGELHVKITLPRTTYSEREKKIYERSAQTCPVALSLHPDIKQEIEFEWP